MNKVRKSIACPKCNAFGVNISVSEVDDYEKIEYENVTGFTIKKTYKCICKKCGESYEVDYGNAWLRRYNPPDYGTCIGDVKKYVTYESEFDASYKIVSVGSTSMIISDGDMYPIVISADRRDELVNNHEKTKNLVYNRAMDRYR